MGENNNLNKEMGRKQPEQGDGEKQQPEQKDGEDNNLNKEMGRQQPEQGDGGKQQPEQRDGKTTT